MPKKYGVKKDYTYGYLRAKLTDVFFDGYKYNIILDCEEFEKTTLGEASIPLTKFDEVGLQLNNFPFTLLNEVRMLIVQIKHDLP